MKKNISLLLYGATIGIIFANTAVARTCNSIYTIMCPILDGEESCCRSSSETCTAAGCLIIGGGTIDPIDPITCPDECPSFIWQDVSGKNYQAKCNTTNNSCSYQCKTGYYGLGSSCTQCPNNGTSDAGSTIITNCYLPDGTNGSDTTGNWTIEGGKCYYNNFIQKI